MPSDIKAANEALGHLTAADNDALKRITELEQERRHILVGHPTLVAVLEKLAEAGFVTEANELLTIRSIWHGY